MSKRAKYLSAALPTLIIVLVMGYIGTATFITAQLTHRVATLSPDSRGISTHIPLSEVAEDLTSPDIHSATIQIASFHTSSHKAQGFTRVVCVGHTDSTGNNAINIPLAKARAQAEAEYLSTVLSGVTITEKSDGSAHPRYSNNTASGRADNRSTDFLTW